MGRPREAESGSGQRRIREGKIEHADAAVRFAPERRAVDPEQFATPPRPGCALFREGGEPILINYSAHNFRWLRAEGIRRKKLDHVRIVAEQAFFGPHDKV